MRELDSPSTPTETNPRHGPIGPAPDKMQDVMSEKSKICVQAEVPVLNT